jgi:hypothetical protein
MRSLTELMLMMARELSRHILDEHLGSKLTDYKRNAIP